MLDSRVSSGSEVGPSRLGAFGRRQSNENADVNGDEHRHQKPGIENHGKVVIMAELGSPRTSAPDRASARFRSRHLGV